ncbi:DUF4440 domain-containing protein [Kosakonia cowanii]|jgi:hypothetical protein|uniref:nuclear transport factor 2 family protein n=1 Tax=Kosakonia cowanii TaxID=208223 RepID=UPI001F4F4168|nr:DUF4440 domain-containing protein [Kosakonia cowanii]MDM9615522.1 DUF4440 domain-containing protein [Kosakonia cowanii]MDP4560882.1 DUF4440 domain-containing protein [Kosakonia cowanii]
MANDSKLEQIMHDDQKLCAKLSELEKQLHCLQTRNQHRVVDDLLHEAFFEIGRSGRRYDRSQVVDALINDEPGDEIHAEDFAVTVLSEGCALLTYRSFTLNAQGDIARPTLRASIWIKTGEAWQMQFHQGTPEAC